MTQPEAQVNLGFALAKLNQALNSLGPTAERKAQQWKQVLAGAWEGLLQLGSRQPVAGVPPWVTLEVAQGGFATGDFSAGGPLRPHELALLEAHGLGDAGPGARLALNLHFLSEAGQAQLKALLASGQYRLAYPESGALLAFAWLQAQGDEKAAASLLAQLTPWLDRLAFYPEPWPEALPIGDALHLRSVGEALERLQEAERGCERVQASLESLRLWQPLHEDFLALALQAWDGPAPRYAQDETGQLLRLPNGQPQVLGGQPKALVDEAWKASAQALQARYQGLRAKHRLNPRPENPKSAFFQLRALVVAWAQGPLPAREGGRLRKLLASHHHHHGSPGEARWEARRQHAAAVLALGSLAQHRRLLAARLAGLPQEGGLKDLAPFLAPVGEAEAQVQGLPMGLSLHRSLPAKLRPLWEASPEALAEAGVIGSLDQLARLLPRLVAQAPQHGPAPLQALHRGLFEAFSRRRSLLLLNLQHQVRLEELPWVAALKPWRLPTEGLGGESHALLKRLVRLAIAHFPHRPWPNPFISQLRALSSGTKLELPWVEELAADIFMGAFTAKFAAAAQACARQSQGRPYAAYYGLPTEAMLALGADGTQHGKGTSEAFLALATRLNQGEGPAWGNPAANQRLLEWAQILTSHNLALAVEGLKLQGDLAEWAPEAVRRVWAYLVAQAKPKQQDLDAFVRHRARAQAWRQALFFLGHCEPSTQKLLLDELWTLTFGLKPEAQARLAPMAAGLAWVLAGHSLPSQAQGAPWQVLAWRRPPQAPERPARA